MEEYSTSCITTPSGPPIFMKSTKVAKNVWHDCMSYRTNEVPKFATKGATGEESKMVTQLQVLDRGDPGILSLRMFREVLKRAFCFSKP